MKYRRFNLNFLKMQTENQTISKSNVPMTNSFLSSNAKYGGLVKKKATKRLRNYLFLLISYIDTISPHFLLAKRFITTKNYFIYISCFSYCTR